MTLWNTTQKGLQITGKKAEHRQGEFTWDGPSESQSRNYSNDGQKNCSNLTNHLKCTFFISFHIACDWTFVLHVLVQISRGSSCFALAVEPASLTSFCAEILVCLLSHPLPESHIWSLNSLLFPLTVLALWVVSLLDTVSFLQAGLCLSLFCIVGVWWSSKWKFLGSVQSFQWQWWRTRRVKRGREECIYVYAEGTAFGTNIVVPLWFVWKPALWSHSLFRWNLMLISGGHGGETAFPMIV